MALDCPVCETHLTASDLSCGTCGLPVGLHPEAIRALADDEFLDAASESSTRAPAAAAASPRSPPAPLRSRDQTAEACARLARELEGHLTFLRQLGGNVAPFTGGLRQAALVQSEGKAAESLELLRAAEGEAVRSLADLFAQRAQELESRAAALDKDGLFADTAELLDRMRNATASGRSPEAAAAIVELDKRLERVERDWRGLNALMQQIVDLQAGAREAGRPIPEVEEDLRSVRELLNRPRIDAEVIDSASQISARALMLLHEALPEILEKDLDRQGTTLSAYPSDHQGSRRAKVLHSEVTRHLRRSRLAEASRGLSELRREVKQLEALAPAEPPARESATSDPDVALPRLLEKARSLASRVRALEPESDLAYEAAGEIRRATELLRSRKLEEADAALTHLMRTLDTAPPEER